MFQISNVKPGVQVGLAGQSRSHADFQPPTLADLKSFPAARQHHQAVKESALGEDCTWND